MGIRSSKMDGSYWVIFDNFHLYYFGDVDPDDTTGILEHQINKKNAGVTFDIQGRKLYKKPSSPGIYIIGGRKVIVK